MNKLLVSIYDSQLERYSPPECVDSMVDAERIFAMFAHRLPRAIYKDVFSLRHLGSFDLTTGKYSLSEPITLFQNDDSFYEKYQGVANA